MQEILNFLSELKENNNKDWFDQNRDRYEASRKKVLFLTEMIIHEVAKFDPEIGFQDPKNCVFRIFRDVRFATDKTPYKTNMGSFIAKGGRKSTSAGYYIHIEPGSSFVGGGSYCPPAEALKAIRTEIFDHPEDFKQLILNNSFLKVYPEMYDDKLKTAPKGFPKDFPEIDLLKYKSFAFTSKLEDTVVTSDAYVDKIVSAFKALSPVNRFLNTALEKWL
ncbi:MAG TPA: TIGR02453 family protein [Prolixibacteraceae bacterium]|nr:TIGR02453 family protein [Prolixibacteraceae bacterium]